MLGSQMDHIALIAPSLEVGVKYQPIRLATWIARTNDIYAASTASPMPLGEVEPMSRGQMNWLITIPADGSLPLQGIAPTLIQWAAGIHPAATLLDSGCTLVRLKGFAQLKSTTLWETVACAVMGTDSLMDANYCNTGKV